MGRKLCQCYPRQAILWHQDLCFYLIFVFTNTLYHIIIWCNLPASGWEIGSVCFQFIQEEAELDSGTSCVPVGGSPVQSHTQTLWGQPPGVEGRGSEEEFAPLQIHTPTHSSPVVFLIPPLWSHSLEQQKGGDHRLSGSTFHISDEEAGPTVYFPNSHSWSTAYLSRTFLFTISPNPNQTVQYQTL